MEYIKHSIILAPLTCSLPQSCDWLSSMSFKHFEFFTNQLLALFSLELALDDGTGFPSFTSGISFTKKMGLSLSGEVRFATTPIRSRRKQY